MLVLIGFHNSASYSENHLVNSKFIVKENCPVISVFYLLGHDSYKDVVYIYGLGKFLFVVFFTVQTLCSCGMINTYYFPL